MRVSWSALLLCAALATSARSDDATLRFVRNGELVRELTLQQLRTECHEKRIELDDPYYGHQKTFLACPLGEVMAAGFGAPLAQDTNVFLRARDGYTKPASGARLEEPGGYLAFADLSNPSGSGWEPIDRRQVDPAPFYMVWTGPGQQDVHHYPWPYQLAVIEVAPFEREYPHTVPSGEPEGSPAWVGFAVFRSECIACHAINGEGGKVGPDLNVPQSIFEYRPAAQIKAFVRDPRTFRYTSMPAHRHLSEAQLDGLVAYFRAMSERKRDPGGADAGER
ncbi:MAG TPA: c-type cytochrome [Myxococcota bacterium]|nr:c-type cytochrome [Myxococcota bacterium]